MTTPAPGHSPQELGSESTDKAAKNKATNKKILRGCLIGGGGVFVLALIIIIATAPSAEERAAEARAADSTVAAKLTADSAKAAQAAAKEAADWAAMPKQTRDSITKARRTDSLAAIAAAEAQEKELNPERFLTVKSWNWEAGGFGSVGIINVTFKNDGVKTAKDIVVKVDFKGESGTTLSTAEHVIPTVVSPGKAKTVNDVNLGFIDSQTKNASIEIVSATFE
jgi:hypothetical protein